MPPDSGDYVSAQDFDALLQRVGGHDAQLRVIASGHAQLHAQLSEVTVTLHRQAAWINETTASLNRVNAAVAENTELTKDIKEAITAGKVASRMAKWMAGAVVTLAAAWSALKGIKP